MNPHAAVAPVLAGVPLSAARAVGVLVHGRGQDERVMLDVAARLALDDVGYVLPVAAGGSWYPGRYYDPLVCNQPWVDWALAAVSGAVAIAGAAGVSGRRIVLAGFSQGACLVAELVARGGAGRLGGAAVLTGCLLGADGSETVPRRVDGLPMFFSCGRHDEWITMERFRGTVEAFRAARAAVTCEVQDEGVHEVSDRAVAGVRALLA